MDIAVALRAFIRTVERSSITTAARDLAVSQPAVTKHIRNLERHVGAQLLERSYRLVRPTPQGRALYEASREPLASLDAALEGVRREMGVVEGNLRLHAPTCVGTKHLHPIVMAFQRLYPAVTVDLVLENRDADLVYENFDLAIKYGRPTHQGLVIRKLGLIRRIIVASPAFIDRFGPVETIEQLSIVSVISNPALLAASDVLVLRRRSGETADIPISPVLRTNSADVIVTTLVDGHAAGPVQQLLVNDEIAQGKLVQILPDYEAAPTEAFLAYPSVRFMRPAVRAFTDFAIPALRVIPGVNSHEA